VFFVRIELCKPNIFIFVVDPLQVSKLTDLGLMIEK